MPREAAGQTDPCNLILYNPEASMVVSAVTESLQLPPMYFVNGMEFPSPVNSILK